MLGGASWCPRTRSVHSDEAITTGHFAVAMPIVAALPPIDLHLPSSFLSLCTSRSSTWKSTQMYKSFSGCLHHNFFHSASANTARLVGSRAGECKSGSGNCWITIREAEVEGLLKMVRVDQKATYSMYHVRQGTSCRQMVINWQSSVSTGLSCSGDSTRYGRRQRLVCITEEHTIITTETWPC